MVRHPPPTLPALELRSVELGVEALGREQLQVRAALDDPALVDDENLIGLANGRQPVRDDDRGSAGERRREGSPRKTASVLW